MSNPVKTFTKSQVAILIDEIVKRLWNEMDAEYRTAGGLARHAALMRCLQEVRENAADFVSKEWEIALRNSSEDPEASTVDDAFCDGIISRLVDYTRRFSPPRPTLPNMRQRQGGLRPLSFLEEFHLEVAEIGTERMRLFSRELLDASLEVISQHRPDAIPQGAAVTQLRKAGVP